MKALSIRQPWAWCIVSNLIPAALRKDVENRDWQYPQKFRGRFAVHASGTFSKDGYRWVQENFPEIDLPAPDAFELGGIVGFSTLVDILEWADSRWFMGQRQALILKDSVPCEFIPMKAKLGFFEVDVVEPRNTQRTQNT